MEVTGPPIRATTFAAITSIEGTGVGITYSPALANTALGATVTDVIFKEATGVSTDTVEVTAAASSYIGLSVDNGTTWQTLTSGTVSPAVPLGSAGTLITALVRVEETLKATRFVRIFFSRA